jgi:hypothetical protein
MMGPSQIFVRVLQRWSRPHPAFDEQPGAQPKRLAAVRAQTWPMGHCVSEVQNG